MSDTKKRPIPAVTVPTPEQLAQEDVMNNCFTRSVIAAVMGACAAPAAAGLTASSLAPCRQTSPPPHRRRSRRRVWAVHGGHRRRASPSLLAATLTAHSTQATEGAAGEKLPWRTVVKQTARGAASKSWYGPGRGSQSQALSGCAGRTRKASAPWASSTLAPSAAWRRRARPARACSPLAHAPP